MNIFCTNDCPIQSALWLDDKRVVKMIVESAQMLSACVNHVSRVRVDGIYKTAFLNHPCTVWARECQANFSWLVIHARTLCRIYGVVFGKRHKTLDVIERCEEYQHLFPSTDNNSYTAHTPFANCTEYKGESYSHVPVEQLYQRFMILKWMTRDTSTPTFRSRAIPPFFPSSLKGA